MPLIEVTHGDGLGGASVNYGFPAHSDEEYLGAVIPLMKQAKVSALLLPGIGTVDHLKMANETGRAHHPRRHPLHRGRRLEQHITMARKLGMDTVGFLMMAHMNSAEGLVKQAKLMEGYGANCIYVTDSAGYMLPDDVKERKKSAVRASAQARNRTRLPRPPQPGHGRGQLARRDRSRCHRIDAAPWPAWAPARATRRWKCWSRCCDRMGIETRRRCLQDHGRGRRPGGADDGHPIRIDRDALTLGYAGVYGSFLLFAKRAEKKYGVPARDILVELGRRGMVGGQEDMIEDARLCMTNSSTRKSKPSWLL
jgi:4-hydroxy-2-oxovalerate/4-hydroxy-2-oxohexanoate aldolase